MITAALPRKDSLSLHLVLATPEEHLLQQHANSTEWRGALSLEAYLRREETLIAQELTKDGGLTAWMLVHQPEPNAPRQVVCGCESIYKRALVARDGKVEDVTCHGVASVFCPPPFRGNGYAGRMMAELGKRLKSWQTDTGKVLFSILFSDIGKDFYAARGWHPFASAEITLHASEQPVPDHVRLLKAEDLTELATYDEELLRQKLSRLKTDGRPTIAVVPDQRTILWHHRREDFVANELHGKTPDIKGAMIGDKPGSRIWAYWTRIWVNPQEQSPNTLHIMRLVIEDESLSGFTPATPEAAAELQDTDVARAIAAIFQVAQNEAARWDMKEVALWNPGSAALAAALIIDANVEVVHRNNESIASLQWYGDDEGSWRDVDWVAIEKYQWC